MVCADRALTCAVRELNGTLQAGPNWFDWLVLLVVPTLVAGATLAVAYASYRVSKEATAAAKRSTELAETMREDNLEAGRRRDREALAEFINDFLDSTWEEIQKGPALEDKSRSLQLYNKALIRSTGVQHSDALAVLHAARAQVEEANRSRHEPDLREMFTSVVGGAKMCVTLWVAHPETFPTSFETIGGGPLPS